MHHKITSFMALGGALSVLCLGQLATAADTGSQRQLVNSGTVGIITARSDSAFTRLGEDLSEALDQDYDLRVLPILGKGSIRNIEDLLLLRGIDVAFTQADVLEFYRRSNVYPDIDERLRYVTKVHDEEMHILARTDIKSVDDLAGKKINIGKEGTGTFMTSSIVLDDLGLDVEISSYGHKRALEMLRNGDLDALVKVDGKPVDLFNGVSRDEGFHFLPIPVDRVSETYISAELTAKDYPSLFEPSETTVSTVAVSSVMAAYNWSEGHEREVKVARFIEAFFGNFDQLLEPPFDPKWADVDLAADVPGWQRMAPAERWLASQ